MDHFATRALAATAGGLGSEYLWLPVIGGFAMFYMAWGIGANDVANALENLAQALSGVVTQYGAYQEAVVQLAAATGTNLAMNAIEWDLPTGGSGSAGTGSSEN